MSRGRMQASILAAFLGTLSLLTGRSWGAEPAEVVVPHGQSRLPGQPLSPADAIRKMTVPKGFSVELVASEPDMVNPVAMTFDERGRVWITESLEYPRHAPGPGRDRVKILEDTNGDGKADKFTVFAEGLNIPSGIAVGHGGVWVANSPDILFFRDTDGDGKADRREVVVTGFGRADTHELPNSLSWGPDGWLYGWNGVFNPSHIEYRGKTHDFTCAIFRINPKTRDFEVFCEGTSNPWGLTWDREGSAFSSACVIDHLWHLTETGYYHRQGGPYPPFTWKMDSIVDHKHQKAAYCGILYYDSDAFPPEYRGKLFMGNIHANGLNMDSIKRNGSTYRATGESDFLRANDAWFMPVSQKAGPDGSLYVLDWYDRYHCYQDANRDPAGIDRLKGRLYRVRYKSTPHRSGFDLSKQSDDALMDLLGSANGFDRETARRLLSERQSEPTNDKLRSTILDLKATRLTRMNALWSLISRVTPDPDLLLALFADPDPGFRAWGVRAAGDAHRVAPTVREKVADLATDPSAAVQLQVAIAARKIEGLDPVALLTEIASSCKDDPLLPRIVWQNLHPLLGERTQAARFIERVTADQLRGSPALVAIVPRAVDRLLARPKPEDVPVERLVQTLAEASTDLSQDALIDVLELVAAKVQSGELSGPSLDAVRARFVPVIEPLLKEESPAPVLRTAILLAATWNHQLGLAQAREMLQDRELGEEDRLNALNALVFAKDRHVLDTASTLLATPKDTPAAFRGQVIAALGRLDDDRVPSVVLERYHAMEPDLQPRAVELLTQRPAWSRALLGAVGKGVVSSSSLNLNQVRKLLSSKDAELVKLVKEKFGTVREGRNPQREQVVNQVRDFLRSTPGDPASGALVFKRICAQCHKIYGEGQEVGPEITLNGRGSYEQLLSNVFDPSLVIGAAYQGTTVATTDGRVLTGLLAERNPQRIVLKMQGGKLETIPSAQVDEVKVSELSLMPEDLDKQLKPQELADLFAYISLDKPPGNPSAKPLPGAEELPRKTTGSR